jgi:hypothetical protein
MGKKVPYNAVVARKRQEKFYARSKDYRATKQTRKLLAAAEPSDKRVQEILDRDAAYEAALSDPFAVPAAPEISPPRAPRDEPAEPAAPQEKKKKAKRSLTEDEPDVPAAGPPQEKKRAKGSLTKGLRKNDPFYAARLEHRKATAERAAKIAAKEAAEAERTTAKAAAKAQRRERGARMTARTARGQPRMDSVLEGLLAKLR